MRFCRSCGKEIGAEVRFCPDCGTAVGDFGEKEFGLPSQPAQRVTALSAIRRGLDIVSGKPVVLVPAVLGAVVSAVLSFWYVPLGWRYWSYDPEVLGLMAFGGLLSLIGGIVGFVMNFASLDMSRNAYLGRDLDVSKSVNYVLRRLFTFIVASIVGALLSVTLVLFPVAILMFVIIVVDETGISAAVSRALRVLGDRLGDVLVLLVIAIVGNIVIGVVPVVGPLLSAAFSVLVGLAFIDIYHSYKGGIG